MNVKSPFYCTGTKRTKRGDRHCLNPNLPVSRPSAIRTAERWARKHGLTLDGVFTWRDAR